VGRLAPGVGLERAQAEMDVVAARFARDDSEAYPEGSGWGIRVVPAYEDLVGDVRTTLLVLFGAVGLVLAIACANVANLLLARATARSKEVAIRTALGSSRRTLVRQFLLEGLVLSALGAAVGLLLAVWGTRALAAHGPVEIPRLDQAHVDGGVVLFTGALVLVTGVVFGLVPVLHSARKDLRSPLQEGGKTSTGGGSHRSRSALVVAEIAVAVVVLVGAGLMIKSFGRMLAVDPGFRAGGVLTAPLTLPRPRYPEDAQVIAFERRLLERVAGVPGVTAAALASQIPMGTGPDLSGDLVVEGRVVGPTEPPPLTGWRIVSPGYFAAMRIPLRGGRDFTAADDERAPGVVIVDEELARRLWPDEEPLGKRLRLNGRTPEQSILRTVVGVAGHVRQHGLTEAAGDQLYVPLAQYPYRLLHLVARTAVAPEALAGGLREAVWAVDRDLPFTLQTAEQVIAESLRRPRFNALLFTVFGLIAFTLTAVGVYGVMAYSVSQRTRDVGIRIALGARAADVLREVVAQGAVLAGTGIAFGLAAAWSLSRLMATLLYGVTATDLATFLAVPLVLGATALAASFFPARRAARVDPVEALRDA
jgi:putative ABC transport system permease protein